MKIMTIVGARPQFIKAAALSRLLRNEHKEILVHTGQHFDKNMSDVFFSELGLPLPDINLGISGGTHAEMTGQMLIGIERVIMENKPDAVLIFGDTNSTLAGALAAVKVHVPVIHVEAGCRAGDLGSPEEVNRVVADHISSLLLCCTQTAVGCLAREGVTSRVYLVGDPMYDAFLYYSKRSETVNTELTGIDSITLPVPGSYYYMTCHRQENTDTPEKLEQILIAMNSLDAPVIYPVHPRNHAVAAGFMAAGKYKNILFVEPVGYLESIKLERGAKKIVTDSGGVQREAFFAGVQCVTIMDTPVWPETMVGNRNQLSAPDSKMIIEKLSAKQTVDPSYMPFGNGRACEKICSVIRDITKLL